MSKLVEAQKAVDFAGQQILKALIGNVTRRATRFSEKIKALQKKRGEEVQLELKQKQGQLQEAIWCLKEITRLKDKFGYDIAMRSKLIACSDETNRMNEKNQTERGDDPSPEEIAAARERIQSKWTEAEKNAACCYKTHAVELPIVKLQ